jgi:hypothetical protein
MVHSVLALLCRGTLGIIGLTSGRYVQRAQGGSAKTKCAVLKHLAPGRMPRCSPFYFLLAGGFAMLESCENLYGCSFFQDFQGNSDVVKQGWIKMFCEDNAKSEKCKRKQLKRDTGKPPPPNMSPTGTML